MGKKLLSIVLTITVGFMVVGCGENRMEAEQGSDSILEKPSNIVKETDESESSERDYGDKIIVNGFWVNKCGSDDAVYYRYIPMMTKKIPGIYDFEDEENHVLTRTVELYNRPEGTTKASIKGSGVYLSYWSNAQLGYNSDPKLEEIIQTEFLRYRESFSLIDRDDYGKSLEKYDVGCITFALYKDLYESFPSMEIQIYGISSEAMGNIDDDSYVSYIKECAAENFKNCDLLGQRNITESEILYVDYKELSKRGDYGQYIIALKVDKTSGFAYLMNGHMNYDIADIDVYEKWKELHRAQFIAG